MRQQPIKILILTSSCGYAHNAAAIAFQEWAEHYLGEGVKVKIEHLLENSHFIYARLVDLYNTIQRKAPSLHHIYYNLLELQDFVNPGTVLIGRNYYINLLKSFQPDILLCTHAHISRGYFELAKKVIGEHLKCITCCIEFQGGYGFTRNWVNPRADVFWVQTPAAAEQAIKLKMSPEKVLCLGNLLHKSFYCPPLSPSEIALILTQDFGLKPDRFTILLGTGGAGANNHISFLNYLLPLATKIQVIALCGHNSHALEKVKAWTLAHPELPVCGLSFTKQMAQLLEISSVVVARPGARTSSEALHLGCPIVFNGIGGIMPQELLAVRYFQQRNLGKVITRPRELIPIIENWLSHNQDYQDLRQRILSERIIANPQEVITAILS